jgi:hypothetical protein
LHKIGFKFVVVKLAQFLGIYCTSNIMPKIKLTLLFTFLFHNYFTNIVRLL